MKKTSKPKKVGERRQKSLDELSRVWKLHIKPRVAKITALIVPSRKPLKFSQ